MRRRDGKFVDPQIMASVVPIGYMAALHVNVYAVCIYIYMIYYIDMIHHDTLNI